MKVQVKGNTFDAVESREVVRIRLNLTSSMDAELFDREISFVNVGSVKSDISDFFVRYDLMREKLFDVKGTMMVTFTGSGYQTFETEYNAQEELFSLCVLAELFATQIKR